MYSLHVFVKILFFSVIRQYPFLKPCPFCVLFHIGPIGQLLFRMEVEPGNIIEAKFILYMGTDCAPLLANLFLFLYEYMYVEDKIKTNPREARLLRHTVRYIDDLLT